MEGIPLTKQAYFDKWYYTPDRAAFENILVEYAVPGGIVLGIRNDKILDEPKFKCYLVHGDPYIFDPLDNANNEGDFWLLMRRYLAYQPMTFAFVVTAPE
jgi:hypothetical protein